MTVFIVTIGRDYDTDTIDLIAKDLATVEEHYGDAVWMYRSDTAWIGSDLGMYFYGEMEATDMGGTKRILTVREEKVV